MPYSVQKHPVHAQTRTDRYIRWYVLICFWWIAAPQNSDAWHKISLVLSPGDRVQQVLESAMASTFTLDRWTPSIQRLKWTSQLLVKTSFKPCPIPSANEPHDSHLALPVSSSPFCTLSHWTWHPFVAHICRPAASGASKLTMLTNSPFPSFSHLFILDIVEGTGGIDQPWGTEQNPDSPIAGYKSQTACREWSRQFVESSRNKDGKWQLCITYIYSIISSWNISLYLVDKTTLTRKCCWKLDDSWWFHMIPIRTIIFSSFQSHSEVTECFTHTQASGRVGGSCLGKKTVWKLNGLWCLNIY